MAKEPLNLIIDTDPGIDDAIAIVMALNQMRKGNLKVSLISVVAGNVGLSKTAENAAKLVQFMGMTEKVPVALGAKQPLLNPVQDASDVHGDSGMAGYDFQEVPADYPYLKEHSVLAMYQKIMAEPLPTTIMAIGPLTNIALLFSLYPDCKKKIKELVIMGGSLQRGNKGVMAEFNCFCDPEAAQIVMQSGVKQAYLTLDVGQAALIYPEITEKLATQHAVGAMVKGLFSKYRSGSYQTGLKMYDCHALAYLLEPQLYEMAEVYGEVELSGKLTRGCTVFDLRNYLKKPANVRVSTKVDCQAFATFFARELADCWPLDHA